MSELTKEEAKRLSIKKWEIIVKNDGEFAKEVIDDPELKPLRHSCGYCHYFNSNNEIHRCQGCPLKLEDDLEPFETACTKWDHPFRKWVDNSTKENAQKVLDLIKNS